MQVTDIVEAYYKPLLAQAEGDQLDWLKKDMAQSMGIVIAYTSIFPQDEFEEVFPEYEAIKPLNGGMFKGIIDGKVRKDGEIVLLEHKTTSEKNIYKYIDQLALDDQATGYIWLTDAKAVFYNIIKKTAFRQATWESIDKYCVRIIKDYKENPEKYVYRTVVYKSKRDIEQWIEETKQVIKDMETCTAFYPTKRCALYGACEYIPLCRMGEDEFTKKELYVRERTRGNRSIN